MSHRIILNNFQEDTGRAGKECQKGDGYLLQIHFLQKRSNKGDIKNGAVTETGKHE